MLTLFDGVISYVFCRLYKSPRPPTPQQTKVSPYKYIRQDLDNPTIELQSAKKSLKFKLDEVARSKYTVTTVLRTLEFDFNFRESVFLQKTKNQMSTTHSRLKNEFMEDEKYHNL